MTLSTAIPNVLTDPGYLLWAPIGSAEPTNTVVGSVFTDSWPVAWINLGATKDGSRFAYETKVEAIKAAELLDPVKYKTTERMGSIAFDLIDITLDKLKKVLNGGTLTVVSGTGTTQLQSYEPPVPGAEVRSMIGWESLDNTLRLICYQCLQGGQMQMQMMKADSSDSTSLPAQFNLEIPTSTGKPWKMYAAGASR